nr:diverse immunoglobulin domain-containing protein 3.1 precursor [Danio rerio]AFC88169.1 diverse immunoglobulin domain-containing protein 3.1 transcript variant 1 [Danio rerio]|eukprot:NP_001245156.1 diverse immunoglobulin domain-containing protein 3.1 precursor [Danio rerio]
MTDKGHVCLQLGLMIYCSLLKGTIGAEDIVFFTSGENVNLPCKNALSGCTSTTWNYNRHSKTVELVAGGSLKTDIKRRERLSVGSDCSLNIMNATKEDYGSYICQQYVNGEQQGNYVLFYLTVLNVSSSLSQTEMRAGRSVTLKCKLEYSGVSCDTLFRTEGYLVWVNQAERNLVTDNRYKIFSSSPCMISLTTTLLNEDHNKEWRCQLTQNNQLKTSASFTVKYTDSDSAVKPDNKTEVIAAVAAVLAALAVVFVAVFLVVFKKRAGNLRRAANTDAGDLNQHKGSYKTINIAVKDDEGAYETIPMSIPSAHNANEQKDDVTYSEVISPNKGNKQVKLDTDRSNETVTYMTIRETERAPQDGLYATVKK